MSDLRLFCTACGKTYDVSALRCDSCGQPLEAPEIGKGSIRPGGPGQTMLERYADFFPSLPVGGPSLGEGFTPLTRSDALAKELGLGALHFKNESLNPTWSFKDRGTAAGLAQAIALGYRRIGTVSTGNMAASTAAYGAWAGLETLVLVNKDIAPEKLKPIAIYGPRLVMVDGDYGDLYFKSLELGGSGPADGIRFINSDAPFRVEGSKTIAFEICEQLGFEAPDVVVVPTSSGGNLRGIEKGFREFAACGLIRKAPLVVAAQAAGCSPIREAFHGNKDRITRVGRPDTIAHAIANPFPPSGDQVLRMLRGTGGTAAAVGDGDILRAQAALARSGIFGQPEAAVPLAVLPALRAGGFLRGGEVVVCVVSGGGLKFTAALERQDLEIEECALGDLGLLLRGP